MFFAPPSPLPIVHTPQPHSLPYSPVPTFAVTRLMPINQNKNSQIDTNPKGLPFELVLLLLLFYYNLLSLLFLSLL